MSAAAALEDAAPGTLPLIDASWLPGPLLTGGELGARVALTLGVVVALVADRARTVRDAGGADALAERVVHLMPDEIAAKGAEASLPPWLDRTTAVRDGDVAPPSTVTVVRPPAGRGARPGRMNARLDRALATQRLAAGLEAARYAAACTALPPRFTPCSCRSAPQQMPVLRRSARAGASVRREGLLVASTGLVFCCTGSVLGAAIAAHAADASQKLFVLSERHGPRDKIR